MTDLIDGTQLEFIAALLVALVCGMIIGVERELKHKPAGLKTQILVVTASMLFAFLSHKYGSGDPTRIAAQIVSGVGFLGAGLILKSDGHHVDNVTTAASIWFAAAVGLAIGFGFYFAAVVTAVVGALVLRLPRLETDSDSRDDK
ncbi:MAG TPA: MgtC/SapB family protein [Candidatus Saccharimonadales bacterium]|nr:MgtC/SapB family protein [Candidatus Saccharimonadales bacterium]